MKTLNCVLMEIFCPCFIYIQHVMLEMSFVVQSFQKIYITFLLCITLLYLLFLYIYVIFKIQVKIELPGTIIISSGKIPERNSDRFPVDPAPILIIHLISLNSQPVLTIRISSVTPPQFPREEALQSWVGFIH